MCSIGKVAAILIILLSGVLYASDPKLIEPADAIRLIGNKGVVFVSAEKNDTFQNEHIVGSVNIPASYLCFFDSKESVDCALPCSCPKEAEDCIRRRGIKNGQMIIVYDNSGGLAARAIYEFFDRAGDEKLELLRGGIDGIKALDPNKIVFDKLKREWQEIKKRKKSAKESKEKRGLQEEAKAIEAKMKYLEPQLLVVSGEEKKHGRSSYVIEGRRFEKDTIVRLPELENAADDIMKSGSRSKFAIIDSRSLAEIEKGPHSGYIPGATLPGWKCSMDAGKEKVLHSFEVLRELLKKTGISKDKIIYIYGKNDKNCGSCLAAAMHYLGYENIKFFAAGWEGWISDASLPYWRCGGEVKERFWPGAGPML